MRFAPLALLASLAGVIASPVAVRDNAAVEPRLLGGLLGKCLFEDVRQGLCELKHKQWNKHECCCGDHEYENDQCSYDDKRHCLQNRGTYNEYTCHCEYPPTCDKYNVERGCKEKGLEFDEHKCACKPCDKHTKMAYCEKQNMDFDEHKCGCKPRVCDKYHVERGCKEKGLEFDEHKCACKPCDKHTKMAYCAKQNMDFDEHKCGCKPRVCDKYHVERGCKEKGLEFDEHKCACKPCDKHTKMAYCEKQNMDFNEHKCGCTPRKH